METTLSKKACDELALKVGKDVTFFPIFTASSSHAFWESVVSICCRLRNHQSMIVIDLRGKDRASRAIPGTAIIRAMDLLKEIGKYVKDFGEKQIVAFFCQYSAHRAPTVAGCMCSNTLSVRVTCVFSIVFLLEELYQNSLRKQHFQQREGGFRG